MSQRLTTEAREDNSRYIDFDIQDEGTNIPKSSMTSATMNLILDKTGATINSRTDIDVLASIDTDGHFRFLLTAADNVIVSTDDDLSEEIHVMKIAVEATVSGNTVNLVDEIYIRVEALRHT